MIENLSTARIWLVLRKFYSAYAASPSAQVGGTRAMHSAVIVVVILSSLEQDDRG